MYRLQRDIHDFGDLLVVELVVVTEVYDLLLARGQERQGTPEYARAPLLALGIHELAFGGHGKKPVLKGGNLRPGTGYVSV